MLQGVPPVFVDSVSETAVVSAAVVGALIVALAPPDVTLVITAPTGSPLPPATAEPTSLGRNVPVVAVSVLLLAVQVTPARVEDGGDV